MLFDDGMKKLFIQLKVIKLCSFVKKLSLIKFFAVPLVRLNLLCRLISYANFHNNWKSFTIKPIS